jgi:hypothetical protein
MQETIPKRIVIYAKDITNITGRKKAAARNLMAKIRKKYKKSNGEFISIVDFCEFNGLKKESLSAFLCN